MKLASGKWQTQFSCEGRYAYLSIIDLVCHLPLTSCKPGVKNCRALARDGVAYVFFCRRAGGVRYPGKNGDTPYFSENGGGAHMRTKGAAADFSAAMGRVHGRTTVGGGTPAAGIHVEVHPHFMVFARRLYILRQKDPDSRPPPRPIPPPQEQCCRLELVSARACNRVTARIYVGRSRRVLPQHRSAPFSCYSAPAPTLLRLLCGWSVRIFFARVEANPSAVSGFTASSVDTSATVGAQLMYEHRRGPRRAAVLALPFRPRARVLWEENREKV